MVQNKVIGVTKLLTLYVSLEKNQFGKAYFFLLCKKNKPKQVFQETYFEFKSTWG
jgi:hypothetical protein